MIFTQGGRKGSHMNKDNTLKAINLINYNGMSINLNDVCMSHTVFQKGQVLEVAIYEDMIVIVPALSQDNGVIHICHSIKKR
jgi:hypothetical protein